MSFKWIPSVELLHKIRNIEECFDNYCVAKFLDDGQIILDRRNFKILAPSSNKKYTVSPNWISWLKRGFFVVTLYKTNPKYYIIKANNNEVIAVASYIFNDEAFSKGETEYFVVEKDQLVQAIFNKNGKRISDWFDFIFDYGLIYGQSDYYMAEKNGKYAIFHKNGRQITDWFDKIFPDGLVKGETDYYLAGKDGKYTIFDKDGKQISSQHEWIEPEGLVSGKSDYYMTKNKGLSFLYKLGSNKFLGPFRKISNNADFLTNRSDKMIVSTIEYETIEIRKEELEKFFEDKEVNYERTK